MSINKRQENYNRIKSLFKIKDNYCYSYIGDKIEKKLENYDLDKIGEGAKGKIFKIDSKKDNIKLAIKVMITDKFSLKYSLLNPRWREVELLKKFTIDVKQNRIRNLPLSIGYQVCKINNFNAIILYYEYFDDILRNWLAETRSDNEWISFILQTLITIKFLRDKYNLSHSDLTWVNIMVNKVEKGGHWKYLTNKYQLYIPNEGYEFIFWDFGSSRSKNFPLRKFELETLNDHFNNRRDQKYILDICKRIRMNHIINRYTLDELKEYFKEGEAKQYYDIIFEEENEYIKRFRDKSRLDYRITKNLAFYLVETDKYNELFKKNPIQKFKIEDDLPLPSFNIQKLLENIVKNDFESEIDTILEKYFKDYINLKNIKENDSYNLLQ